MKFRKREREALSEALADGALVLERQRATIDRYAEAYRRVCSMLEVVEDELAEARSMLPFPPPRRPL